MPFPVFAVVAALPTILPAIVSVVQTVEGFFGGGKGEVKRAAVAEIVLQLLKAYEGISDTDVVEEEELAEGVGQVIDGVVAILNATGVFKR